MPRRLIYVVAVAAALFAAALPAAAQGVDVIRGLVTGPDDAPIENANVTATSVSGGVNRYARTDKQGVARITAKFGSPGIHYAAASSPVCNATRAPVRILPPG